MGEGEAISAKAEWTTEQIAAFNRDIFSRVENARRNDEVADLSGVVFPDELAFEGYNEHSNILPRILFSQAVFCSDVLFVGVHFGGQAAFDGTSFAGHAVFRKAHFYGHAGFKKASFGAGAWFEGARFGGTAWFQETTFRGDTQFRGAWFGNYVWFQQSRFHGNFVAFKGAIFKSHAGFQDISISGDASFQEAKFENRAQFQKASFGSNASFTEVIFQGCADFGEATFKQFAHFEKAVFSSTANMKGVRFEGDALFSRAKFGAYVDFSDIEERASGGTNYFGSISFVRTIFGGPCHFHNRKFLSTTDFRGALFEQAPEFHGCTLHQDTVFPPARNFRDRGGGDAARAYRTLKQAMAGVHARGEEAKFFALEQESLLRDKDTSRTTKLFSSLYRMVSDYGQSELRPLVWLLVTFLAFFAVYTAFLKVYLDLKYVLPLFRPDPLLPLGDVLRFSLQQVFQPFEVFRARGGSPLPGTILRALPEIPLPLAFLAAVHSVLTLSFLALFLLALRRRFKLD